MDFGTRNCAEMEKGKKGRGKRGGTVIPVIPPPLPALA